ncbi:MULTISPECIES: PulJ/GspJ family protein [Deinococcus]|uniref:Type II secretion system protein J n=1 Tax=Deinococcus rufus TaxID=2136097 RepID=A0ABV7Z6Z0_9DEIO|nr:prepilin-type N-terminal cleavage/methylation domain-containing protein [Deinococcus sp. AB2017081]WQE94540.1 prepilin-type N-terminal cleavage/methylation domain-containing protein [Deinococcus sp. AB2017081]
MTRTDGFTLIEILVAMAIFAVVTIAALELQGSTTRLSGVQISQAQRLQTLSDTSGYLADQIRAGAGVYTGLSLPDGLGGTSTCALTGTQPCLAVLVPVTQPLTCTADPSTIVAWRLHAFRYVPRTSLPATYKGNTVHDADAYGLLEVRISDPANPAPAPGACGTEHATIPTSVAAYQTSSSAVTAPLADDLSIPAGTVPFAFDATTNVVTLRLQSASRTQGKLSLTPATPYELKVKTRNR